MSFSRRQKQRGFTLVELVVVIVLLGITAVTFTSLITGSVLGYLDTANRQDSAAVARIALDRLSRELREAMPQSIRINPSNTCIQFLPIHSSFVYTELSSGNASVRVIETPGGAINPGPGFFAAVYPVNANELYNMNDNPAGSAMRGVAFAGVAANIRTLTLNAAFVAPYPRTAAGSRLYIVGQPVSYCFTAGQLLRYTSAVTSAQPTPGAGLANGALLVDRVVAPSTFTFASGNWQNNALVTITLTLQQPNTETLTLDHEVWLRNVQ